MDLRQPFRPADGRKTSTANEESYRRAGRACNRDDYETSDVSPRLSMKPPMIGSPRPDEQISYIVSREVARRHLCDICGCSALEPRATC